MACCTFRIAVASPSACMMRACFWASAFKMADCFSPSATRILLAFSPSAWRMDSRRSRSAFICFSMAFWISRGGRMFFSSTRLTLMPQGSVASSRMARILALMVSRLVRRLVQLQLTDDVAQGGGGEVLNGAHGILHAIGVELGVGDLKIDDGVDLHGNIVLGDDGLGVEIRHLLLQSSPSLPRAQ